MTKEEFSATLGLVGTVGFLSALLPSVDKLIEADPTDKTVRANVVGANTVFGVIALILIGNAFAVGHRQAAAIGALVLGTATFYYNYAFLKAPIQLTEKIKTIPPDYLKTPADPLSIRAR